METQVEATGISAYVHLILMVLGVLGPIVAGFGWRWANRAIQIAAAGAKWLKEDREAFMAGKLLAQNIAAGTSKDPVAEARAVVIAYDDADEAQKRILAKS